MTLRNLLRQVFLDDSGQDLVEYGILAAVLAVGAGMALKSVNTSIATVFTAVGTALTSGV